MCCWRNGVIQKKEYSLSSTPESRFVFRDELNFTVISDVSPIKIVKYINGKEQVKKQLKDTTLTILH